MVKPWLSNLILHSGGSSMRLAHLAIVFAVGVLILSASRYIIGLAGAEILALLLGAFGALVLLVALVALVKTRTRATASPVLIAAGAWAAWMLLPMDAMGMHAKFWLEHSSYEATVAQVTAGQEPSCVLSRACLYEARSPIPLAFPWEGIIDNWIGIVYDPTGTVTDAISYRRIFGGDLMDCEHINGPYFLCSFT